MNKVTGFLWAARIGWAVLIAVILLNGWAFSWKLALIAALPLALVAYGPLRGDIRGNQWAAFAVTPYFMYGVTEEVEQLMIPDIVYSAAPTLIWLSSTVLFSAAMMHSRWAAQAIADAAE